MILIELHREGSAEKMELPEALQAAAKHAAALGFGTPDAEIVSI